MSKADVLKAVAVTAELCGRVFSSEAAAVFADDLSGFDERAILGALKRCRMEVRGALTTQDVISRLEDGRPGPDEAWAMIPRDEADSVVWTDEMAVAWGVASGLIDIDRSGAYKAFRECYVSLVSEARQERKPANWTPSLGHDPRGRDKALQAAVLRGRIAVDHAERIGFSETPADSPWLVELSESVVKRLQ